MITNIKRYRWLWSNATHDDSVMLSIWQEWRTSPWITSSSQQTWQHSQKHHHMNQPDKLELGKTKLIDAPESSSSLNTINHASTYPEILNHHLQPVCLSVCLLLPNKGENRRQTKRPQGTLLQAQLMIFTSAAMVITKANWWRRRLIKQLISHNKSFSQKVERVLYNAPV